MSHLHDYLQDYINDLQSLLNAHQDEEAFVKAVKDKWANEDDLRCAFVISCQGDGIRLQDEGGEETDEDVRVNVPIGKERA